MSDSDSDFERPAKRPALANVNSVLLASRFTVQKVAKASTPAGASKPKKIGKNTSSVAIGLDDLFTLSLTELEHVLASGTASKRGTVTYLACCPVWVI